MANQKRSETLDLGCTVYDNCNDYAWLFGSKGARAEAGLGNELKP